MQLKKKTLPTDFCTFISKILCDLEKDSCMFSMCFGCPGIECIKPQENLNKIAWQQWKTMKIPRLINFSVQTVAEMLKEKV